MSVQPAVEAITLAGRANRRPSPLDSGLQSHGVSLPGGQDLRGRDDAQTIALVQADPYRLEWDLPGVGFLTADKIAQALGVPVDAPQRAGDRPVVRPGAGGRERPCVPVLGWWGGAAATGSSVWTPVSLSRCSCSASVTGMAWPMSGSSRRRRPTSRACSLPHLVPHRRGRPGRLPGAVGAGRWRPLATFRTLDCRLLRRVLTEGHAGLALTERQAAAVEAAFTRPLTVLTGGPGTGKTVTLGAVIRLADASGVEVVLACPTGRAAKRLSEATGQLAQTVHRLLEVKPQDGLLSFTRNEAYPLDADLVIVDEASMLDLVLAYSLVRAIRPGADLMLVGDVDQLPSVGPGNVLRDVIAAIEGGLPNAALIRLDAIFRQAAGSYIIDNAHRVVRGQMPVTDDSRGHRLLPGAHGRFGPRRRADRAVGVRAHPGALRLRAGRHPGAQPDAPRGGRRGGAERPLAGRAEPAVG